MRERQRKREKKLEKKFKGKRKRKKGKRRERKDLLPEPNDDVHQRKFLDCNLIPVHADQHGQTCNQDFEQGQLQLLSQKEGY